MEFAVGRASRKSPVKAYQELEKKGSKWHLHGYVALFGNYMLMMFYTTVAGWMLYYFYGFLTGKFTGQTQEGVTALFGEMLASPGTNTFWMVLVVILGIMVCSMGLQAGVERITKGMMIGLLSLMIVLAVHGLFLDGGAAGLRFYLLPDFEKFQEVGVGKVIVAAMNQSFFTLSLGIGANFWKLSGEKEHSAWRSGQCGGFGYLCSYHCRTDHFPGVFCFWSESG